MEIDDMNRRELLRLLSLSSAVVATPIDWDRVAAVDGGVGRVDLKAVNEYAVVNQLLWQNYSSAPTKSAVFPAVREHLGELVDGFGRSAGEIVHRRLCELTAEILQIVGEILFDGDRYADAAHCYTVAAALSKEAVAWDLWACALTRHAYVSIHDDHSPAAVPLLVAARKLADRGDGVLATRYWVDAVHAQALAGLGEGDGWERAADSAQGVLSMSHLNSNGWLRFDGSRLAEDRATCLVQLGQAWQAEQVLTGVLDEQHSSRRRASVLVDLAAVGALNRDPIQVVMYGDAALDIARQTRSGYVGRRLEGLRRQLGPLCGDRHVRHLDDQIATLATNHADQTT
ncbi:transcriptional regulator [Nocardia sp. NPDC051463]|uniref:transcriptional regulator n=1 Tax=Nocardia sp. NPDC051463 TaxID=3154845 RepID=UPI003447C25E